jgi:hypothetical protein
VIDSVRPRNKLRARIGALALAGMWSIVGTAASEERNSALPAWAPGPKPNVIEDRFRVEVMTINAGYNTDLRIDPTVLTRGTRISAEDDLALDETQTLPQAEITLLPGQHHLLRLSGLGVRRSARTSIDRQIVFDDQIYRVGERVDSELNLTAIGLTYGYRFLVHERAEIAGTFGIQIIEVEANAVVRSRVVRDAESAVAPLPLLGVEGRFDFTRRWSAEGRAQYLDVTLDDVEGSILDARFALAWRMNPYLVFGLGYRRLKIHVDSEDRGSPGFVNLVLDGPLLFVRGSL